MTVLRPNLKIVEQAFEPLIEAADAEGDDKAAGRLLNERKIVQKYAPSVIKVARARIETELREELEPFIVSMQKGAVDAAMAPLQDEHARRIAERDRFHDLNLKAHGWGRLWLGLCSGIALGAAMGAGGVAFLVKDQALTRAAATHIESQGRVPALVIHDATPGYADDVPDAGYARGHEPRSAP